MKNKNAITRAALTITLVIGLLSGGLFGLPDASAESIRDKWFIGGGFGRTFQIDSVFPGDAFAESDNTFRFIAGYHLFKYLAIEGGIVHFNEVKGNFTGTVTVGGTPFTGTFSKRHEISGIELNVVWHFPFWKSDTRTATFFLKGGGFVWNNKEELDLTPTLIGVIDSSGTDVTAGFGIQIRGEGNAAFRFEVQRVETDELIIDTATINFLYYF